MGRRSEPITFPKQDKVLYCFKFIEYTDSIELKRYDITEYKHYPFNNYVSDYKFEGRFIDSSYKVDSIRNTCLDKVMNKKFFTFNSDLKRAAEAFDTYFKGRLVDAEIKYTNAEQRYGLWKLWRAEHA